MKALKYKILSKTTYMSMSQINNISYYCADGEHVLVVLFQQVYGVHGHTFLRATQEKRACVYLTRHTSRYHAYVGLVWTQVCPRSVNTHRHSTIIA